MDQNAPRGDTHDKPSEPARTALGVLALCFALSVLGRGLGESFTVFLLPISESFGWDRAQVVSVYSLTALAGGLASPLIGRLFDYSGPRSVYSLGLLLLGGAFLFAANADHLWQFQLSLGLCVGFGIALIGNVPNSILLGRWFGPRPSKIEFGTLPIKAMPKPTAMPTLSCICQSWLALAANRNAPPNSSRPSE